MANESTAEEYAAQELKLKMHREIANTKFTLSQIQTLTSVAYMTDLQHTKYKVTSIYNLQTGLKHFFDDPIEYSHTLLTMEPDDALIRLKKDLSEKLAIRGLELDNRTANTEFSSHSAKETGINPPKPYSGQRQQPKGRNMTDESSTVETAAKEAVDYHRQIKRTGNGFTAKATHAGYKLYAAKNPRKAADPGHPGQQFIIENPGVTFEDFAEKFAIDHLNWDINRGAVAAVGEGEEFDFDAFKAAAEAKKPKAKKVESSESEEADEEESEEAEA